MSCEHLEVSDDGICKACGVDITSQEFIDSLPEIPPNAQFGNIPAIVRLAEDTAHEFLLRVDEQRDPHLPTQPKIRWVGTMLVRPPREAIWTEVVRPAYAIAKGLGYRGDYGKWEDVCLEYVVLMTAKNSQKT